MVLFVNSILVRYSFGWHLCLFVGRHLATGRNSNGDCCSGTTHRREVRPNTRTTYFCAPWKTGLSNSSSVLSVGNAVCPDGSNPTMDGTRTSTRPIPSQDTCFRTTQNQHYAAVRTKLCQFLQIVLSAILRKHLHMTTNT